MDRTVGTCSLCKGRVTVPQNWLSVVPPIPTCESCSATAKQPYGGTIEMEKPSHKRDAGPVMPFNDFSKPQRCPGCENRTCGNAACPQLMRIT